MVVRRKNLRVCIQGLWHLGSVTAACLSSCGHQVVGLDFIKSTIEGLQQGAPPILEPGLEKLTKESLASGHLTFTDNIEQAVKEIEVLWVTYDTPVDDSDIADTEFVFKQIKIVLPYLPDKTTILISSQMPVGSIQALEKYSAEFHANKSFSFAYSPENLRLGNALNIFLNPDRIVVGIRSDKDKDKLTSLLSSITEQIEWMTVESAEMTKHAINAFLATSVTFANELASICELVGADAKEVERGLKTENRIGPKAYLSPGGAFAGGTLARDINFLNNIAVNHSLTTPLLSSIKISNDEHKLWIRRRLKRTFPNLSTIKVSIWGLTYKPGTDTLRRSMAIELCTWLIEQGTRISVHDPAVKEIPAEFIGKIEKCDNPSQTLQNSHALVIATEWPEYRDVKLNELVTAAPELLVFDANRFLSNTFSDGKLKYFGVGAP